ncbi:MAG: sulfatase [bacterium]|nr:sulfatase [bacterium]
MRSHNRRNFLKQTAAAALLPAGCGSSPPPNILFAISDDVSWPHASAYGDPVVRTPVFDRVARDGVRFTHAFSNAPSCTPSRGAILTGQHPWRLEENANLWSTLQSKFEVYPDMLEAAGYVVGFMRKSWAPGKFEAGGRTRNPAGPRFASFGEFFQTIPRGRPFCFWFGSSDAHRPYEEGSGLASGMKLEDVVVPPWLPDVDAVRGDMLDYYFEIQRFDRELGEVIGALEAAGLYDNTIVVVTSDNGMPFPRAKATLYDGGVRMPLAVSWPARVPGGRVVDDFVSLADFAPTFLEAAGLEPPPAMTGRSLLNVLLSAGEGRVNPERDRVFTAMERHAWARTGGLGYPMRAIRTYDHLYIRNFEPDRWPAGIPDGYGYGEIPNCPTKTFMLEHRDSAEYGHFFDLACAKRPAEELYHLASDPYQLVNVAATPAHARARQALRDQLDQCLRDTGDPRLTGGEIIWDTTPFYGRKRA